jgi:hypothetical protein
VQKATLPASQSAKTFVLFAKVKIGGCRIRASKSGSFGSDAPQSQRMSAMVYLGAMGERIGRGGMIARMLGFFK